jgi:hypothetical protein
MLKEEIKEPKLEKKIITNGNRTNGFIKDESTVASLHSFMK